MLACGSEDGTIGLWEIDGIHELRHWKADASAISSVAFAPDGKVLVSGSEMGYSPRQWDVATGRELRVFGGHRSMVDWLSFSPDGKQLFSAADEKTVLRWDLRSGREERWFSWPTEDLDHFLPSPDGKAAATLGYGWKGDGVVRLWDIPTGKEQRILGRVKTGAMSTTRAAAFSPAGKLLAAGSGDGTVHLWEVDTGKERGRWRKLSGYIQDLAFSPDGKLVDGDAGRAYRAAWLLASDTERTVPFLQRQWRSLLAGDEKKIARQIADLASDQFEVRERAMQELEKHGLIVLSALHRAISSNSSAELRRRTEQIREKLDGQLLRLRRMVFVLEQLGNSPARQLLADIANRQLDDRLTHEARTAMQRLQSAQPMKTQGKRP
jgi:hypothetical protein